MEIITSLLIIAGVSLVIYFSSNFFARSSSMIGDYFKLSKSVKGATLDAIASSLPELMVALFSVIIFKQFEVGVGTVAGSALFNLLIIPGICVLVAPVVFRVSKEVVSRDALFYIISVFVLLVLVLYFKVWGLTVSIVLLLIYLFYIRVIAKHTKKHKENGEFVDQEINILKEMGIALTMILVIGIATYFLTEQSIHLANALKIHPIIIAFTITAAATSLPDTIISVVNARKGDVDDAVANVFGSNIFDILVGLGLPLLVYFFMKGPLVLDFNNLEIVVGLLGATIVVLFMLAEENKLSKRDGIFMLLMYAVFIIYVVSLSIA